MNSATISISSVSDFRIHGTLAVSTSALLRCTTMHGGRRQSDCSGCQQRAGAGGSTGRARIEGHDFGINPHLEPAVLPCIWFAGYEEFCRPLSAGRCSLASSVVIVI